MAPTQGYASQQNPHAERACQTIQVIIRCLLFHANAPFELWEFAALQAAYIHNCGRIRHKPMGEEQEKTPHQYHHADENVLDIKNMQVMFCDMWCRIGKEQNKMEPKAFKAMHLGFDAIKRQYVCWARDHGYFNTRDALFMGNDFDQLHQFLVIHNLLDHRLTENSPPIFLENSPQVADEALSLIESDEIKAARLRNEAADKLIQAQSAIVAQVQGGDQHAQAVMVLRSRNAIPYVQSAADSSAAPVGAAAAPAAAASPSPSELQALIKLLGEQNAPSEQIEETKRRLASMLCDSNNTDLPFADGIPWRITRKGVNLGSKKTDTQRCTADSKTTKKQCKGKTRNGKYCYVHLKSIEGLRVKRGSIDPKGVGLFAARDFEADEVVARYTGELRALNDPEGDKSDYSLQIQKNLIIDASIPNANLGRVINDGLGQEPNNCKFAIDRRTKKVQIRTTKRVKAGEEFLIPYGKEYWNSPRMLALFPRGKKQVVQAHMAAAESRRERESAKVEIIVQHLVFATMTRLTPAVKEAEAISELSSSEFVEEPLIGFDDREQLPDDHSALKTALEGKNKDHWRSGLEDELNCLRKYGVYKVVPATEVPKDHKILPYKVVLKVKRNTLNEPVRCKVRITCGGHKQEYGKNYLNTYAPTLSLKTLRVLFALAAYLDLEFIHLDVETAFLNGILKELVFMKPPPGLEHECPPGHLLQLLRTLYGLKQASYEWCAVLFELLAALGYTRLVDIDDCVFILRSKSGKLVILAAFVDDLFIFYWKQDEAQVRDIIKNIKMKLKVKEQSGDTSVLGLKITRDRVNRSLLINQEGHINALLTKYGMDKSNPMRTPEEGTRVDYRAEGLGGPRAMKPDINTTVVVEDETDAKSADKPDINTMVDVEDETDAKSADPTVTGTDRTGHHAKITLEEYRNMVGSLQYIATCTRPDIAHAVSALATHSNDPKPEHLKGVARVMRYLRGTAKVGLLYVGKRIGDKDWDENPILSMYSDSDWAGTPIHSRSTTGLLAKLAGGPVTWKSKLQTIIALSSSEAEYIAVGEGGREIIWLRNLLHALWCPQKSPTPLFIDNQNAILMIQGQEGNMERRKHIQLRYHWIKQQQALGLIVATKIDTKLNEADPFTKGLGAQVFVPLVELMLNIAAQKKLTQ
jgi:hypothetical protein